MAGSVCISFEALEVLTDEPANCMKLYVWLCVHLDRKTGIVGKRRRISEQYAKERLEVSAVQGRKATVPTRQEIRSVFQRLETLKLLIPVDGETFVFSMPYESALFSVQNNNNQTTTKQQPPQVTDFTGETIPTKPDGLANNNQPIINQSINQTAFCMSDLFLPSEHFAARSAMAGFDVAGNDAALLQSGLLDLRMYWMANRPNEARNQVGWELALLQTMRRLKNQPVEAHKPRHPAGATGGAENARGALLPALPRDDEALEGWASKVGAPMPGMGETFQQYRRTLQLWRDHKQNEMNKQHGGVA